mmetsp:Transcript_1589/g.2224  ORF Transcript_1589/g.2224 Transcript_1589/m.2224 type:complete len:219 (-) Transcript_1589:984-1640(-)
MSLIHAPQTLMDQSQVVFNFKSMCVKFKYLKKDTYTRKEGIAKIGNVVISYFVPHLNNKMIHRRQANTNILIGNCVILKNLNTFVNLCWPLLPLVNRNVLARCCFLERLLKCQNLAPCQSFHPVQVHQSLGCVRVVRTKKIIFSLYTQISPNHLHSTQQMMKIVLSSYVLLSCALLLSPTLSVGLTPCSCCVQSIRKKACQRRVPRKNNLCVYLVKVL